MAYQPIVSIISVFDHALSGYEYFLALSRETDYKCNYVRKNKTDGRLVFLSNYTSGSIKKSISDSDVLIIKGDNYFEKINNKIFFYNNTEKTTINDFGGWDVRGNVKIIMVAGGSGFRRNRNNDKKIKEN